VLRTPAPLIGALGFIPNTSKRLTQFTKEIASMSTQQKLYIEDPAVRRDQLKLVYDYIKFHIGLYLSTPAVLGLIAKSFDVEKVPSFQHGLILMILAYLVAGAHAAWFMGTHVNRRWEDDYLGKFESSAYSLTRRLIHHWLYWLGLIIGLGGLGLGILGR
jgi:hypothetical protein